MNLFYVVIGKKTVELYVFVFTDNSFKFNSFVYYSTIRKYTMVI